MVLLLSLKNNCGRALRKDLKQMRVEFKQCLNLRSTGGAVRVQEVTGE